MKDKIYGYKFLTDDMKSRHGNVTWKLGEWNEVKTVMLCESGFHASRSPLDSLNYIYGDRWFMVEAEGYIIDDDDKFVASRMRILKELPIKIIALEFAISCAKNNLFRFERKYPDDSRPREAIIAAQNYLDVADNVYADLTAAFDAAHAAAFDAADAAHAAACAAACDAAYTARDAAHAAAAYAARAAAYTARDAAYTARDAAYTARAASYAARAATRANEIKFQNKKLLSIVSKYV